MAVLIINLCAKKMSVGGQCHTSTTLPSWERTTVSIVPQTRDATELNRIQYSVE